MSGVALIGVVILVWWAWKVFPRSHRVRKASAAALLLMLTEALLGAGLVLFQYVAGNVSTGRALYLSAHMVNTLLLVAAITLAAWWSRDNVRPPVTGVGWLSEQRPFVAVGSEPVPDAAAIPGRFEDYTDHPTAALLIVEVSDTTLAYDTTTKAELYATAGVPEYWVLDVTGRQLFVFRDPQPLAAALGAVAYQSRVTLFPTDAVTPLHAPNVTIAVADLLP